MGKGLQLILFTASGVTQGQGLFPLIMLTPSGDRLTELRLVPADPAPGHVMVTQITLKLSEGSFTHERDLQKIGITCRLSSGHPGVKADWLW